MLKAVAAFSLCVASSGLALAEDRQDRQPSAPQALSDAELDAITAGAPGPLTVIISNPGKGLVFKIDPPSHFICINCGASSDKTNGVIITPSGKFIVIPGGPFP